MYDEFIKKVSVRQAEYGDVDVILDIMGEAYSLLEDKKHFFTDDREFIREGIHERGFALIAQLEGEDIAYMTVRFPGTKEDNLGKYLSFDDQQLIGTAMLDSVAVKAGFRGHGIQKLLIEEAEKLARAEGYIHFLAKTHPDNRASLKSFISRGYHMMLKIHEQGTERVILYKSIFADEQKEHFRLFDEKGEPLELIKERNAVHRDGNLHGAVHIWIMEKYEKSTGEEGIRVLLQKRSANKDSFPNCFDCSCAGHLDAGEDFISAALRELLEELSFEADEEDLEFLFKQIVGGEYRFHDADFKNHELNYVYLLKKPVHIEVLNFQKEEIQGLEWQDAAEVAEKLYRSDEPEESGYCIWREEFMRVLGDFMY